MSKKNLVETLFPEECISGTPSKILDLVSKNGIRNLAYDGNCGCNPGYIFRGELDFASPLQCSIERRLRSELKTGESLSAQQLQASERRLITTFIRGDGGYVAATIDSQRGQKISQSIEDVFWWLSLMQHYGHPTRLIDFTKDIRLALFFAIEQLYERREKGESDKDLMIYCFPCKDLTHSDDDSSNKTPIAPNEKGIDMNRAVGCLVDLEWMRKHAIKEKRANQLFGWDRPSYQNSRLRFQRGMFVFPYDYPQRPLNNHEESWLVQNLQTKAPNCFNMSAGANGLHAKRIRILSKHAADLKNSLAECYRLTSATVYVDYAKVEIERN